MAMVFDSTTLASSWEPFRGAIETLSEVYTNQPDLVVKHKIYLDIIGWAELSPNTPITFEVACKINTGVVSTIGVEKNLCACIYVDDTLLLGHSKLQVLMKLAMLIKAIFVITSKPDTAVRQCPLTLDKWVGRTDCRTSSDDAGPRHKNIQAYSWHLRHLRAQSPVTLE
jgi:hypothetical protein